MTTVHQKKIKLNQDFQSKLFDEGAVIYLDNSGGTIQLDHISFCILEIVAKQNSNIPLIIEELKLSSENTVNFSAETITPYIDSLISQNIITVCLD